MTPMMLCVAALAFGAPATSPAAKNEIQRVDREAVRGHRVWFAMQPPDWLKPQLEEKRRALILISFLPFGAVWGPVVLLGQHFDLSWALPSLAHQIVGAIPLVFLVIPVVGWGVAGASYVAGSWLSAQTMLANLNRDDIPLGDEAENPEGRSPAMTVPMSFAH